MFFYYKHNIFSTIKVTPGDTRKKIYFVPALQNMYLRIFFKHVYILIVLFFLFTCITIRSVFPSRWLATLTKIKIREDAVCFIMIITKTA